MDWQSQLVCLNKVCQETNNRELLSLSYSDIRRIAAIKAADRLQQLMKLQKKRIHKGTLTLNSKQEGSLLPTVSDRHIESITDSWAYFVKYTEYHGVMLLICFLQKNPDLIKLFPKLDTGRGRRCFQQLKFDITAIRYGRSLMQHITDIVTNLRNNGALESYIKLKFSLLEQAGLNKDGIQMYQQELLTFLAQSRSDHWEPETSEAWRVVTTGLVALGTNSWSKGPEKRGPKKGRTQHISFPNLEVQSVGSKSTISNM